MESRELDERFDNGEDVLDLFDLSTLKRPALETRSVSVNLPQWMISALDPELVRLDIDRQSIVKFWIAERLEKNSINSWAVVKQKILGILLGDLNCRIVLQGSRIKI